MTQTFNSNLVCVNNALELVSVVLVLENAGQHLLGAGQGDLGWSVDRGMKPPGEAPEGFSGFLRVLGLLSAPVAALGELALVGAAPAALEVAVDVDGLLVADVQVVAPAAERLPAGVPVEGTSGDSLQLQPPVGERGHVPMVLAVGVPVYTASGTTLRRASTPRCAGRP